MPTHRELRRLLDGRLLRSSVAYLLISLCWLCTNGLLAANGPDFQHVIQPLFNEHCVECHGGVKKSAGFSVLSRSFMMTPGDSNEPGLIPGNSEDSLLIQRIQSTDLDERMPPDGHDPLSKDEIRSIKEWIDGGAVWPEHWSFSPIKTRRLSAGQHPVDAFIRKRLSQEGFTMSPPAHPSVLMRRLSLDLIGLLPDKQMRDTLPETASNKVYERWVDELLASPHFGERWGRHWLDEARYADSLGYEKDSVKEDAWQYRDWVVRAFNDDMRFDQFSRYQLAGDLLDVTDPGALIATKLHLQTQFNLEGGIDAEEDRVKRVVDRVNMVGSTWLGLTIGCSQCHDHPYDSISQKDFYAFFAFFNNMDFDASFLSKRSDKAESILKEREEMRVRLEEILQRQVSDKNLNNQTVGQLVKLFQFDNKHGLTRHMQERSSNRRKTFILQRGDFLRPDHKQGAVDPVIPAMFRNGESSTANQSRLDLVDWMFSKQNPLTARVVVNKVWMHLMGSPLVDTVQDFGSRGSRPSHPELLDWLAHWWMHEGDWSMKRLIRLLVTSDTYRQSSIHRSELTDQDPENRLFARQNRFRVEAEILRDISLQVAGLLNRDLGGPCVFPPMPDFVLSQSFTQYRKKSTGGDRYRRGIYTFFRRTAMDPNLTVFDCPDASASKAVRDRSNNALQAMTTLNNEVFHEAAQAFSVRLLTFPQIKTDRDRLIQAFVISQNHRPSSREISPLVDLLNAARAWYADHDKEAHELIGGHTAPQIAQAEQAAWIHVARIILNLDAFLTRE